jgi:hypothetical protein
VAGCAATGDPKDSMVTDILMGDDLQIMVVRVIIMPTELVLIAIVMLVTVMLMPILVLAMMILVLIVFVIEITAVGMILVIVRIILTVIIRLIFMVVISVRWYCDSDDDSDDMVIARMMIMAVTDCRNDSDGDNGCDSEQDRRWWFVMAVTINIGLEFRAS